MNRTPVSMSNANNSAWESNINHLMSTLYTSGRYSDLTIKCQNRRWKAHRAVVCVQSRPLAAAIDGSFPEAISGEIDLEDDEPEIVELLMSFFYRASYPDPSTSGTGVPAETCSPMQPVGQADQFHFSNRPSPLSNRHQNWPARPSNTLASMSGSPSPFRSGTSTRRSGFQNLPPRVLPQSPEGLVTHAKVYIAAEKWDVQPLRTLAKKRYETLLPTAWNSDHFVESLKLIYDGTPDRSEMDGLRALVIKTAGQHARELLDRRDFLNLCQEVPGLATDVLKAAVGRDLFQYAHDNV